MPARTPSPGCGWPAADPARSRPWLPAPRSARAPRGSGSRPARRGGGGGVPSLGLCAVLWRRRLRSLALRSASVSLGPAVALGSLRPLAPGPLALRRSRLAFPPPHPSAPLLPQPAPARRRRRLLSGAPGRAGSPPLSPPPPPPGASSVPRLQPAGPGGPPTTARAGREPERGTEEAGRRLRPAARRPPARQNRRPSGPQRPGDPRADPSWAAALLSANIHRQPGQRREPRAGPVRLREKVLEKTLKAGGEQKTKMPHIQGHTAPEPRQGQDPARTDIYVRPKGSQRSPGTKGCPETDETEVEARGTEPSP